MIVVLTNLFEKYPSLSIVLNFRLQINVDQGSSLGQGPGRYFERRPVEEELRQGQLEVVSGEEVDALLVKSVCYLFERRLWKCLGGKLVSI